VAEVRTEESFGLVDPKHHVSIQDLVGGANLLQAPSALRYCSNCGGQAPGKLPIALNVVSSFAEFGQSPIRPNESVHTSGV
jgi:hypothetical protein